MKHRSIGERIRKAQNLALRQVIAMEWAATWQVEHDGLICILERAVSTHDFDTAARMTRQLKAVGHKRFRGMRTVITALADEDID